MIGSSFNATLPTVLGDRELIQRYRTCIRACFDPGDIKLDMYGRACKLMELSSDIKLSAEQEGEENDLFLWQLIWQANRPRMDFPFASLVAPFVIIAIAGLKCAL